MCEPYHSIVQYPDDYDDSDLPFGGNMDKESRLKAALGKTFEWARKFGKWFHLSKFGAGHSGATRENYHNTLYLPTPTLWEGRWWDRTFHLDSWGRTHGESMQQKSAAHAYHEASALGNMSLFRRFLETSMKKTNHPHGPWAYTERLVEDMLTTEGKNAFTSKFNSVFGRKFYGHSIYKLAQQNPDKIIKLTLGFTRKRNLLLPHFADDDKLWT